MPQRTGMLTASVEAERGSDEVRVALLSRGDLERLLRDQAHGVLAATAPGESGLLQHYMPAPGYCSVVMDNRNGYVPAVVRLHVWLDAGWTPGPAVTQLSRRRQVTVIAISFAVFFGIAGWSARRLLQGIRS